MPNQLPIDKSNRSGRSIIKVCKATRSNPPPGVETRCRSVLEAIWEPVFIPSRFARNSAAFSVVIRYGWTLIVVRWLYYSIVFQFRDYNGGWTPFVRPPFGLSIDTYARLQRWFALPFGVLLMLILATCLVLYLRSMGKQIGVRFTLNVLGATFFLPFVLLQPCDRMMIALAGWRILPVIALHTAVLVWESWAAIEILSATSRLTRVQRLGGIALLCVTWIGIVSPVWR